MSRPSPAPSTTGHEQSSAPFRSILFGEHEAGSDVETATEPTFFHDLNLDQIVDAVTASRKDYHLTPYFCSPLDDLDLITYRQDVFDDLSRHDVHELLTEFTSSMRAMREDLARGEKYHYYKYPQRRWFLNAVERYCDAVIALTSGLDQADLDSGGLLGLRAYLRDYASSDRFHELWEQTRALEDGLDAVRYCLLIKGNRITVGAYDGEPDYSEQVAATFERFQQGAVKDYRAKFKDSVDLNHVEAGILDLVAKVYPDLFGTLDTFYSRHKEYLDHTIGVFDRELQFFLSYLAYTEPMRTAGLEFTYPQVSSTGKAERISDTFDLALAAQLTAQHASVVCNDFHLDGPERILVVSGPNNGGKTTLARTVGQLHYLARLGCPIPGRDARLFLCDAIYTHFEREEDLDTLEGKLQDELNRFRTMFSHVTSSSVVIMNEMFNSTTAQDALFLSKQMLERLTQLDVLAVCVTFLDELASLNDKTVSMVSTVVPGDPATRTYKLIRKPADGRAFALAIAEKYQLTYDLLTGRVTR